MVTTYTASPVENQKLKSPEQHYIVKANTSLKVWSQVCNVQPILYLISQNLVGINTR